MKQEVCDSANQVSNFDKHSIRGGTGSSLPVVEKGWPQHRMAAQNSVNMLAAAKKGWEELFKHAGAFNAVLCSLTTLRLGGVGQLAVFNAVTH
jgi:hypothetical protein